MNTLPTAFQDLLATVADAYAPIAEHARPNDPRTSVWEVEGPGGVRWFVKQNAGPRLHAREVAAYQTSAPHSLGADRVPTLVVADATTRTLIVTAVPGVSLDRLRLPAEQQREAYRQAGQLLARLHSADTGATAPVAEPDWHTALAKKLDAAAAYLVADQLTVLRNLGAEAPVPLPPVVAHGDYMPKNWMWDEREQYLRIIDFERTGPETAARRDLCRLHYRVLHHQPDLAAAFQDGYGRLLTAEEEQARTAYAVLDAADALSWGIAHRDVQLVDEAHTMIENLRQEHVQHLWGGHRA